MTQRLIVTVIAGCAATTMLLVGCTERAASSTAAESQATGAPAVQTVRVEVTERGFEPASLSLTRGSLARVTFVRRTDQTCGTEVVVPSLKERRPLPLNEPVTIELTPRETGEIAFACGMDMLKGVITVQ